MRYDRILCERRSTEVYYHVTPLANVPSILKHGLIANKANDGGGRYEDSRFYSLEGVYAASDPASDPALLHTIIGSMDGDYAVIILSVSPESSLPDEDVLEVLMGQVFEIESRKLRLTIPKIESMVYNELDGEVYQEESETLQQLWDKMAKAFHEKASQGNPNITFDKELVDDLVWHWAAYHIECYQERESGGVEWMETKDALVRKYPNVAGGNFTPKRSVRLKGPVTYRGRNRILAIVDGPESYDVRYGQVPSEAMSVIHELYS